MKQEYRTARMQAALDRVDAREAADQRLRVRRTDSRALLGGISESTQVAFERSDELEAIPDNNLMWITTASIYDKLRRDIRKAYESGPVRLTDPRKRLFAKPKRPRSAAQIAALRAHNQQLKEAKQARAAEASNDVM